MSLTAWPAGLSCYFCEKNVFLTLFIVMLFFFHFFLLHRTQYDLVELRAVTACLPERFEVDGDGRKAAWRAAFLQRVQGLVAQVSAKERRG